MKVDSDEGARDTFAVIFGNDLWIYLTFIMVSALYFTTHFYIKFQVGNMHSEFQDWACASTEPLPQVSLQY